MILEISYFDMCELLRLNWVSGSGKKTNFKEIITLDYLSHIKLKNKKINHTESETFISKSEFDELDKLSCELQVI